MSAITRPTNVQDAEATGSGNPITRFLDEHYFVLRRLHSLSGVFPVGLFVIAHLFTNAQMAWGDGGETFQHEVDFIHSIPALVFIEIALWSAIAFHAGLGIWYTVSGKSNVKDYGYGGNWRYTLQRWSGIVALVFIFFHIATLRWRWDILGWFTPFYGRGYEAPGMPAALADVPLSMPLTAYALQVSPIVALFYILGALAVVFHWSNGLWTAAISWGLTISEKGMKRWGYACVGLFVALTVFFGAAIVGAMAFDFDDMPAEQIAAFSATVPDSDWIFDDFDRPQIEAILDGYGTVDGVGEPEVGAPAPHHSARGT
ncbi:hypothetical protein [Phycisphaera mikurensis]|uniref:hypothetical protein n=1 Tax=Phycisphaera mikurensis TaxID=547188 RepID=UPI00069F1952|nr:hypothetical protein [Phycisphaera mikurensis]MBB6440349.1 succinate dehydrogenase / fumarate reductase cytochrome b subunit [Phycisphaera mikurensis]